MSTENKPEEKRTSIEWMKKISPDPFEPDLKNVDVIPNWENKPSVKKGNIGERIVIEYLEKKGYCIYKCITKKKHAFDLMAIKDKKIIRIAEVKSKARMPNGQTGINLSNYRDYVAILSKYNLDTFVFFVDEHPKEERIYGNYISALKNEVILEGIKYPYTRRLKKDGVPVTFFHTATMKNIVMLTKEEADELRKHSKRNYAYE